eukprot:3226502-Pyramimonas_sp.AAC.1
MFRSPIESSIKNPSGRVGIVPPRSFRRPQCECSHGAAAPVSARRSHALLPPRASVAGLAWRHRADFGKPLARL